MNKIAIIGYGSIGKRHLNIIRNSSPNSEIIIFRHKYTTEIPEFADHVTNSINVLVNFKPSVAIIANPAPFHMSIAEILIEYGCHLLIEKPISNELNGVQNIIDCMLAKNLVCQIGYNLRFLPSLIKFRNLVKDRIVGEVLTVRCEVGQYLPDWRPNEDYRIGVSSNKFLGGGVLLELSHEIDYLRWIFGDIKWVRSWFGNVSNLEIDVEDTAFLLLGIKRYNTTNEIVASLNMDFVRRDVTRNCTLVGENGSIQWNGVTGTVKVYTSEQNKWTEIAIENKDIMNETYIKQWEFFKNSVEKKSDTFNNGNDGLEVIKVIEAARISQRNYGMQQQL